MKDTMMQRKKKVWVTEIKKGMSEPMGWEREIWAYSELTWVNYPEPANSELERGAWCSQEQKHVKINDDVQNTEEIWQAGCFLLVVSFILQLGLLYLLWTYCWSQENKAPSKMVALPLLSYKMLPCQTIVCDCVFSWNHLSWSFWWENAPKNEPNCYFPLTLQRWKFTR